MTNIVRIVLEVDVPDDGYGPLLTPESEALEIVEQGIRGDDGTRVVDVELLA